VRWIESVGALCAVQVRVKITFLMED